MKKGFTLVELVIVIIIVGILSLIAVPIYRKYVERAQITEGKVLARAIFDAGNLYHLEIGEYYNPAGQQTFDTVLGIDARGNKYFTAFLIDYSQMADRPNFGGEIRIYSNLIDTAGINSLSLHVGENPVTGLGVLGSDLKFPFWVLRRKGELLGKAYNDF